MNNKNRQGKWLFALILIGLALIIFAASMAHTELSPDEPYKVPNSLRYEEIDGMTCVKSGYKYRSTLDCNWNE